ncbi:uncharacterized protein A4U43_C06F12800 [Asparagus officinalis]|uniref:RNase H type-1 domain-containing protein n=1 Tax=Asparagus officinalis TaxID=4686 RepID=A0A5P1ELI8_ASPOF|nr:uncharacterized protein A4U43_C06F12800 [Asparagus officinalis]
MDWIIHLDTDELMHPARALEYSLRRLLADVPSNVDMVIFPNYESSIERDDVTDPFSEESSGEIDSKVVPCSPDGSIHEQFFVFSVSNNEAKYEVLLAGLRATLGVKVEHLYILANSQLVVRQVNGE